MELRTTFWSSGLCVFDHILLIEHVPGEDFYRCNTTFKILDKANLKSKQEVIDFFLKASKFFKSSETRKKYSDDPNNYCVQFGVYDSEHGVTPLKWFDLFICEGVVISHDILNEITLIERNKLDVPFGRWRSDKNYTQKHRGLKVKQRVYKYIANQVRKYHG